MGTMSPRSGPGWASQPTTATARLRGPWFYRGRQSPLDEARRDQEVQVPTAPLQRPAPHLRIHPGLIWNISQIHARQAGHP